MLSSLQSKVFIYFTIRIPVIIIIFYSSVSGDEQEVIELVPNIILNPVFYDGEYQSQRFYQLNENFTDEATIRLINNSVLQPVRL